MVVCVSCVSGWIVYVRHVGRQVWGLASGMDLIGDPGLERSRDCTSAASYGVGSFFLGESSNHGLNESMGFPPPLATDVKDKGI